MTPLTRDQIAHRIARELKPGWYVNLGIGMPGLVSNFTAPDQDMFLQSENGILHYQGLAPGLTPDFDCIDASKRPVTVKPGGCYMDVSTSFGLMRGGHLDVAVLGAFEVSQAGDLANWSQGHAEDVPGVGGAMDLACGAKAIWAMLEHTTKKGSPKIVKSCSYPLTARGVVSRIFTDLAMIDVGPAGLIVREMVDGLSRDGLQSRTDAPLSFDQSVGVYHGAAAVILADAS